MLPQERRRLQELVRARGGQRGGRLMTDRRAAEDSGPERALATAQTALF
jgi:hypothetical protein